MMSSSKWRGNLMEEENDVYLYSDTKQKVSENKNRSCGHCGKPNTKEGHDGCIGTLEGVMNACCGHGVIEEAFVQYENGNRICGDEAIKKIKENENENKWNYE